MVKLIKKNLDYLFSMNVFTRLNLYFLIVWGIFLSFFPSHFNEYEYFCIDFPPEPFNLSCTWDLGVSGFVIEFQSVKVNGKLYTRIQRHQGNQILQIFQPLYGQIVNA